MLFLLLFFIICFSFRKLACYFYFITETLARPPSSLSLASMTSETSRLSRPPSVTSFVGPLSPVTGVGHMARFPRTGSVGHLQQLRSPGINLTNLTCLHVALCKVEVFQMNYKFNSYFCLLCVCSSHLRRRIRVCLYFLYKNTSSKKSPIAS